jgi:speckle-type POZ protein
VYSRQELEGAALDVAMAQHLLVAADRFQLPRLRRICERRLCETVEVRASLNACMHACARACVLSPHCCTQACVH